MEYREPIELGHKIYLIDGFDLGFKSRTGSYIFDEKELTIIETGPGRSVPHIKEGLKTLGKKLEDVKHIILTHIHLDHAGGAGILLQECPNAKVYVHPRGFRHLVDPERLIAGAKAVYGDAFDELFAPILPIPEERLVVMDEGDKLVIGPERILFFFDTPGHAKHHLSIYDPYSQGIFTGDTIGVRYADLESYGGDIYLPTTSPNQFDPEAMLHSMEKIRKLSVKRIYFGHFGVSETPDAVYYELYKWLPIFVEEGKMAFSEDPGNPFKLAERLTLKVTEEVKKTMSVPEDHDFFKILALDMQVCSMGIFDYLSKQNG